MNPPSSRKRSKLVYQGTPCTQRITLGQTGGKPALPLRRAIVPPPARGPSDDPSPDATVRPTPPDAPPHADDGRDSQGRFSKGNPGVPGNPYYRRQAQLKRMMLEAVTDVDMLSVMRVLLGLARTGDLAAIKLFLESAVGRSNATVDSDKTDLHEWELKQQTPKLEQVIGLRGRASLHQRLRERLVSDDFDDGEGV